MNRRYHWDRERGLTAIRRSPNARDYPTVDEIKAWMGSGVAPSRPIFDDEEPDRCPTCGRAFDCICLDCEYCGSQRGTPRRRTDPTGTE